MVFALLTQRSHYLPAVLHSVYGIWNMDYFRLAIAPFCVSETMSTFGALSCGYIAALWPLFLILFLSFAMVLHKRNIKVIVFLWQVINKISCGCIQQHFAGTNLIHTFATFFLLSYLKSLFVSFSLLRITIKFEIESETGALVQNGQLSADPHIAYFSLGHLLYAVPALVVVFLLGVILPLLLILYTTRFNAILFGNCRSRRGWNAVKTFLDAFQGSYKDGTNGTRDYRAMSALYLVLRFVMGFTYSCDALFMKPSNYFLPFIALVFIIVAGFFGLAKPYKTKRHNLLDVLLCALSAVQIICLYATASFPHRSIILFVICSSFLPIVVALCVALKPLTGNVVKRITN